MKRIALLSAITALILLAAEHRVVRPANGPKPIGPYSPGILAGGSLYVSGQGARPPEGDISKDPVQQVRQTLDNIKGILEGGGHTLADVQYSQVYLSDVTNSAVVDKVWKEYFPGKGPERAVLGVALMPTGTPVEINAVAIKDPAKDARVFIGGVSAKTAEEAMKSFEKRLRDQKLSLGHLVFVNVYIDPSLPAGTMNAVYRQYFEKGNAPARATIPVNALPDGNHIELTGVAVKDLAWRRAVRPKNMAPSDTASPCVWARDVYYCSAKSGFIPGLNGGIWAHTVDDQVRQTMRNLLDGLEETGLDFSSAVATNVYLDNLDEFAKMNGVYARYFGAAPPTRTTVQPLPPVDRKKDAAGHTPKLEEISLIGVRH